MRDDVLSASGSEFQKGKGYGDDITEGKRTLIVIHALKNLDSKDRERLLEILGKHTTEKGLIDEALELLKKKDSVEYVVNKASKIMESAWDDVKDIIPDSEAKKKLHALADFLIKREK